MTLTGHTDTITGLAVSPDGNHLLSNAMVRELWSFAQATLNIRRSMPWQGLSTRQRGAFSSCVDAVVMGSSRCGHASVFLQSTREQLAKAEALRASRERQCSSGSQGSRGRECMQDNTLRAWDMRPYAPQNRCMKVFVGHQHSFERNSLRCDWSPDGTKVGPPWMHPASGGFPQCAACL